MTMGLNRKYSDEKERLIVTNKLITLEYTIYYVFAITFSIIELYRRNFGNLPYVIIALSILFASACWILYIKDPSSASYIYPSMVFYFITYILVLVFMDEQLTLFTALVLLTALVVRYDNRLVGMVSLTTAFIGIFNCLYQIFISKNSSVPNDTLLGTLLFFWPLCSVSIEQRQEVSNLLTI